MPAESTQTTDPKVNLDTAPRPTSRVHLIILGVTIALTLGLRSCHLLNRMDGPLAHPEAMHSTDMAAFSVWARKIADGDWLCRDTYHPYTDWMERYASLETFEQWWGGKAIYHQNPLYAYVLAISYALFDSGTPVLWLQVLMSTLAVGLIYDIGRQLLDPRAGLCAAALAALFAPSIVMDAMLLRTAMSASVTILSVWLLFRLRARPAVAIAAATGVCLAASFMLRPTGLLLLVAGPLLLLMFTEVRARWKHWVPALAVGVVVVFTPFVVRNVVVGAPALAFSTRGPETFLQANTRGVDPGFMTVPPRKEDFVDYMNRGSGSLFSAFGTAVDSFPANGFGWWLRLQGQKLVCALRDYEYQNNVNFYYYRLETGLLTALPTFGWFVGPGVVGLAALCIWGRDRRLGLIALVALAAMLIGTMLGFALGRYRMPFAILMTIPAGAMISLLVAWLRGRRPRDIGIGIGMTVIMLGITVFSYRQIPVRVGFATDGTPQPSDRQVRALLETFLTIRPQEHRAAARELNEAGRHDEAVALLDDYLTTLETVVNETGKQFTEDAASEETLRRGQERLFTIVPLWLDQVASTFADIAEPERSTALRIQAAAYRQRHAQLRSGS